MNFPAGIERVEIFERFTDDSHRMRLTYRRGGRSFTLRDADGDCIVLADADGIIKSRTPDLLNNNFHALVSSLRKFGLIDS